MSGSFDLAVAAELAKMNLPGWLTSLRRGICLTSSATASCAVSPT